LFDSSEEAAELLNDESFIADFGSNFESASLKFVGASVTGFRWLTANKAVNSFEDMQGLKVRTMENSNHMTLWNSLGTNATPMSGAELFTALQQGTVDGQENPVSTILNGKIYEVNNYLIDTRHIISVSAWLVNPSWYDALTDDQKAIFDEAIAECISLATEENASEEEENIKTLEENGMTVVEPDDAWYTAMKEAVGTTVEDMIRSDIGDEAVDSILSR
jgi:TRAP-type C4-dicarboxylate transport system substrate-binding protein